MYFDRPPTQLTSTTKEVRLSPIGERCGTLFCVFREVQQAIQSLLHAKTATQTHLSTTQSRLLRPLNGERRVGGQLPRDVDRQHP